MPRKFMPIRCHAWKGCIFTGGQFGCWTTEFEESLLLANAQSSSSFQACFLYGIVQKWRCLSGRCLPVLVWRCNLFHQKMFVGGRADDSSMSARTAKILARLGPYLKWRLIIVEYSKP